MSEMEKCERYFPPQEIALQDLIVICSLVCKTSQPSIKLNVKKLLRFAAEQGVRLRALCSTPSPPVSKNFEPVDARKTGNKTLL